MEIISDKHFKLKRSNNLKNGLVLVFIPQTQPYIIILVRKKQKIFQWLEEKNLFNVRKSDIFLFFYIKIPFKKLNTNSRSVFNYFTLRIVSQN